MFEIQSPKTWQAQEKMVKKFVLGNLLFIKIFYFAAIIQPVSFGIYMYNYDVIHDVIASMETLKCGSPQNPTSCHLIPSFLSQVTV